MPKKLQDAKEVIIQLIPSLDSEQLLEIKAIVDQLYKQSILADKNSIAVSEYSLSYHILCKYVEKHTKQPSQSFFIFSASPLYPRLIELYNFLIQLLDNIIEGKETRTLIYEKKLISLFCQIMIADFNKKSIPIKLTSFLFKYHNFPSLLDMAFPEYIVSGLGLLILKGNKSLEEFSRTN